MTAAPRILIVEDDDDTRQLMAVALGVRGYAVEQAGDADEGVRLMREGRYDLLLADYDMPRKTGATMIREAAAAGLLDATAILMITAHPDPEVVEGVGLVRKPLDLDKFLLQVATILAPARQAARAEPEEAAVPAPPRAEFVLYVARSSPASLKARRRFESLLAACVPGQVRFQVCDLALRSEEAERDGVIYAPTLLRRAPSPKMWVLGDLADEGVLEDLLSLSGIERIPAARRG